MKLIKSFYKYLDKIVKAVVLFLSFGMIAAAFCQIMSRELLPRTWAWTDEVSRYCMVWLTYLAAGLGVRYKSHVRIDTLYGLASDTFKKILDILANTGAIVFGVFVARQGFKLSSMNMTQHSASMHWPMGIVYLAVPIGGILIVLFAIECIINLFVKDDKKEEEVND